MEFLQLPETKPASEYIDGEIIQKPMPKGKHSRLQGKLGAVNDRSVLVFHTRQQPELLQGGDRLLLLEEIKLEPTANQVFGWLKMEG